MITPEFSGEPSEADRAQTRAWVTSHRAPERGPWDHWYRQGYPQSLPDLDLSAGYPAAFGGASGAGLPQPPARHAYPEPDWAHDTLTGLAPARERAPDPSPLLPPCRCDLCEWAFEAGRGYDGPCKCDACKYGRQPGSGVVLYDRPGAASMLWAMAVRDEVPGYGDIEGEFDAVWRRTRKGFAAAERHARRTLDIARHQCEAVTAAGRAA